MFTCNHAERFTRVRERGCIRGTTASNCQLPGGHCVGAGIVMVESQAAFMRQIREPI